MQLAWNELTTIMPNLKLVGEDLPSESVDMVRTFNSPSLFKEDLNDNSYYVKAWHYSAKTINTEVRKKFPKKSFGDVKYDLVDPCDFVSYAYFLKKVSYPVAFKEFDKFPFNDTYVSWFHAINSQQKSNIKIHKYVDDDKFLISLQIDNGEDEIYLAKWYHMDNPASVIKDIRRYVATSNLDNDDEFAMPKLSLNYFHEYSNLIGLSLQSNKYCSGTPWNITQMFENIKFDLDHEWARVENEALIEADFKMGWIEHQKKKNKKFILDKPFWVVMKQTRSENPYLILGVRNTAFMEVN